MKIYANPAQAARAHETAPAVLQNAPHPTLVLPLEPAAQSRRVAARSRGWARRVHAVLGIISALNLLLLISTGFLLQHREAFRLDERVVSRRFLTQSYRPQDGPGGVRGDIVVADLHSGRLFGRTGALVLDGITLGWLVLLGSGLVMYAVNHRRKEGRPGNGNGQHSQEA